MFALVLLAINLTTYSEEYRRIAIQAEVVPLTLANFTFSSDSPSVIKTEPPCMIGIRCYVTNAYFSENRHPVSK